MAGDTTNPATAFAVWIEPILNRWKAIIGALVVIIGGLWSGAVFAHNQFDSAVTSRVEARFQVLVQEWNIKIAEVAQRSDLEALSRKFNGAQEQINTGINTGKATQQKVQSLENALEKRDQAFDKQLQLIIKLIEQKQ